MDLTNEQQQQAANLWGIFEVAVKFNSAPRRHPKQDFLGFADLRITALQPSNDAGELVNSIRQYLSGFRLYLNGVGIKVLQNAGANLDFRNAPARDGSARYFSNFAPGTPAMRAFLTASVFSKPVIKQAQEAIQKLPKPAGESAYDQSNEPTGASAGAGGRNPFAV